MGGGAELMKLFLAWPSINLTELDSLTIEMNILIILNVARLIFRPLLSPIFVNMVGEDMEKLVKCGDVM